MIHPTAVVDPRAELDSTVQVGAFAVIGEHVRIGPNTIVGPHVVIDGWTQIGADNEIYNGATIGTPPQDLKYKGEPSCVRIGDGNRIREFVTINRGTVTDEGNETVLGNHNLLMAYVHVGHNCVIGNNVIITNTVALAGHIHIESQARIGGMVGLHQFVHVGRLAMIGAMARIDRDVPPFTLVEGHPGRVRGLNWVGLERAGISDAAGHDRESYRLLRQAYKLLYRNGFPLEKALQEVQSLAGNPYIDHLLTFLQHSAGSPARRGPTPAARRRTVGEDS
ncbi:UDP-N-acetylglucosamine acyltransferase [Gloeobacter kilaueensis JS1]|uniref:Acyl-[acyl-carrier-protein]--UDP-N-acetylglucosamine O-acyltransferase n=1 Tax=Gloeobacter kilaueensis (strain ATCC BAA-2537 / CCAP 1431/1 / ULC 316 / JS1) TaxID=1183438 RepID=U5QI62_GLOK1|nr:UDP-N-acetylglucosamine acyltransferase [Gloeobacter kilaueensis JS1]